MCFLDTWCIFICSTYHTFSYLSNPLTGVCPSLPDEKSHVSLGCVRLGHCRTSNHTAKSKYNLGLILALELLAE